ncbi:hypothetical protein C1H46_032891 [Malus baccata]|uniref:Uncharacterized protein n=1 Tax=Malus baccata TaxID=106549 RepID=A0A540L5E6_MALBA|nr:hypothetical protein C1H46_032891 [Malus baccata]
MAFAELIQELKPKLDEKIEVLAFIYKSPFGKLVKAYVKGELQMKKSYWDVIHIVNWYDVEKGMFKLKNGYCQVNTDDVQHIFWIPNRGKEAPHQSTRDSRILKPKENIFVDRYF